MYRQTPKAVTIRSATAEDEGAIVRLLARAGRRGGSRVLVLNGSKFPAERAVRAKSRLGCLLVAENQGELRGIAGIDLDRRLLSELVVRSADQQSTLADALLERAERLAVAFGLRDLRVAATPVNIPWFLSRSYGPERASAQAGPRRDAIAVPVLARSLRRRQSRYARRIAKIGEELGIPVNYGQLHRLPLQHEASKLKSIGPDVFGREQWMSPRAAAAWQCMGEAALEQEVKLQAVSAWRSVDYQCELLRRKLAKGQIMDVILEVSAAPGYSEHHTGRAVDVTTPGYTALSEEFAQSPGFKWLQRNAARFGFCLSFPRGNRHKLAFEPWHWCFRG